MALALPPLRVDILIADRVTVDTRWNHYGFNDPYTRLYFIHNGFGTVVMNGRTWRLTPGTLTAIPAHTTVDLHCPGTMDVSYIHCSARFEGGMAFFSLFGAKLQFDCSHDPEVRGFFASLRRQWSESTPAAVVKADGIIRQLLARFCTGTRSIESRLQAVKRFAPALAHIESHLGEAITVPYLARLVNLHPTYFANAFSHCFGMPPRSYIVTRRIEVAKTLLRGGSAKLEAVARDLGFSDQFHLSKTFSRLTGVSPREYRRRIMPAI